jgi:hypothetical protein
MLSLRKAMNWNRISFPAGVLFAFVASVYASQLPAVGPVCIGFTLLAACALLPLHDRQGSSMGLFGTALTLMGIYLFVNSFAYGPGFYDNHLFYRDGPEATGGWEFLGLLMLWLGTAMALRGIILGVHSGNAANNSNEGQRLG